MPTEPMTELKTQFESPYFAAIDLGSNSFHMLIVRLNEDQIDIIDREKDMVQIARGLQKDGSLSAEAKERAIASLTRFAERLRDIPSAQIRAVGTKALRAARDTKEFLKQAEAALGVPIQIISGYEEARLVYSGFSHSVSNDHSRRLVIDIGGGSTEFIVGVDYEPALMESLGMGCVFSRPFCFTNRNLQTSIPICSTHLKPAPSYFCISKRTRLTMPSNLTGFPSIILGWNFHFAAARVAARLNIVEGS